MLAKKVFSEGVTEEAAERFIVQVKNFAEEQVENWFFERSENPAIVVAMREDEYRDFSIGYIAQMREWQRQHPAKVEHQALSIDTVCSLELFDKEMQGIARKHLIEAGIGTITSVGIGMIVSGMAGFIIGLIAEMIVLAVVHRRYQASKEAKEAFREQQLKMKIEKRCHELVNNVSADISAWLDEAEKESRKIEESFRRNKP